MIHLHVSRNAGKIAAVVIIFLVVGTSYGQNLTGVWLGSLPQDDKREPFSLELNIQHEGNMLQGTCKIVHPSNHAYVVQKFKGRISGNRVTMAEYEVLESHEVGNWLWCVKSFDGELTIDEGNQLITLQGKWTGGDMVYAKGRYVKGRCSPGTFRIEKRYEVPKKSLSLSGLVLEEGTKTPVQATVTVTSPDRHSDHITTSQNGVFSIPVKSDGAYIVNVTNPDFESTTDTISISGQNVNSTFFLKAVEKPVPFLLNTTNTFDKVLFNTSSAEILQESHEQLNSLIDFLAKNFNVQIQIDGHTDKIGNSEKNLQLSWERTDAIKHYLMQHGISGERIVTRGHGDTKPVCKSPCKQNRRVEFVLTNK